MGRTAVEESRARTVTVSRDGHARATATSSSVCDGCSGRAATVQTALDALIAQLQAEFGPDTVTVDVDTAAG